MLPEFNIPGNTKEGAYNSEGENPTCEMNPHLEFLTINCFHNVTLNRTNSANIFPSRVDPKLNESP